MNNHPLHKAHAAEDWRESCHDALDLMRDDPHAGRVRGEALLADAMAASNAAAAACARLVLAFAELYEHRFAVAGPAFEAMAPELQALGDRRSMVLCLFGMMISRRAAGRLVDAYALGQTRLLPAIGPEASREKILALNAMAIVAHESGFTEQAVGHYFNGLDAARQLQLPARIAHLSANLGEIFYASGNAVDAEVILIEAQAIARSSNERWIAPFVATMLALTRLALERVEEAYQTIAGYLPESDDRRAGPGGIDLANHVFFLSVAAYTHAMRDQLEQADVLNRRALKLIGQVEEKRLVAYTWWVSGHLHKRHGRFEEAIQELNRGIREIGDRGYLYLPIKAMQELSVIYELQGEWQRAYREQQRFHALSTRAQEQAAGVRLQTLRIKSELKEAELARRHAEQSLAERLQLQQSLQESLAERETILDNVMVAIIFLNPQGRVQWANQAMYTMFQVEPGDYTGLSLEQFYPNKEEYYRVGAEVTRAILAGQPFEDERQMRRGDGSLFWAYTSGRAVNQRDATRGTVWALMDISKRRQLEADLHRSQEHYRQVVDNVTECILVVQEGRIIFANKRVFELTGYDESLFRVPFLEAIHPEDQPLVMDHHVRRLRGEKVEQYYQFRLIPKGTALPIWVELSAVPIEWEGKPATLSFMTDITERRRLEESLKQSLEERMRLQTLHIKTELREAEVARQQAEETTRAKSMFLANMSHEIRTPMNAIIGMAHLALRTELNNKQRDYVEKIHGAGVSLLGIINDILDFSKVEAGKLEMEQVEFSLDRVFNNVATVTSGKAHEKGLEYLLQMPASVPTNLIGDPLRLGQVLINLVNNAIKFTEHGEICIACKQLGIEGDRVTLEFLVRDTGIGMHTEQTAKLFQAFSQADESTTRKYGGTGLGLSISKGMVELMDGQIWLESSPEIGTEVHFTASFALAARQPQRQVVPQALNGMRILVVDDNPVARQILVESLSTLPLEVDSAAGGEQALQMIIAGDAQQPYGIVFTDVRMPGMDGFALTVQVKKPGFLQHPPRVVLVSAYDRDEVRLVGPGVRAEGFLAKPVSASALVDAMIDLLAPSERVARVAASIVIPRFRDLAVLLVEDNEINQQIAAELMEAAGIKVALAGNGRIALEMLAAVGPDFYGAVLMDVQMPEMDGHEATRTIRADARYADLPIIAMTAHAMVEERARCTASGMDDHITKPINPVDLFETLSHWCPLSAYQAVQAGDGEVTVVSTLQIAGIDVQDGLSRTLGNEVFYLDMLARFREGQRDAVARMREALAQHGHQRAEHVAHTLKGVAGQLGAHRAQALAAQMESHMREKAPATIWTPLLDELDAEMRALDAALAQVVTLDAGGAPTETAEREPDHAALLAHLRRLLQDSDAEAVDLLRESGGALELLLGADSYKRIARAVRHFDFDAALLALGAEAVEPIGPLEGQHE